MPNLKSIKQIFRTIHRLPQPAFLHLSQCQHTAMKRITCIVPFILVAQHHATVVHTHRQSRIFFLKDTNQINEVSPSSRWELSIKFPPGIAFVLRKCTKWVRLANFLASSRVSFCSPALNEPAQKSGHYGDCPLHSVSRQYLPRLSQCAATPIPEKEGHRGVHIFTPYSSHTGMMADKK